MKNVSPRRLLFEGYFMEHCLTYKTWHKIIIIIVTSKNDDRYRPTASKLIMFHVRNLLLVAMFRWQSWIELLFLFFVKVIWKIMISSIALYLRFTCKTLFKIMCSWEQFIPTASVIAKVFISALYEFITTQKNGKRALYETLQATKL